MFTQTHMHIYMDKHMHAYVYTFDVYIKRKIGIVCKYEDINTIVCKCIFFFTCTHVPSDTYTPLLGKVSSNQTFVQYDFFLLVTLVQIK